jgi:ABC-type dipeptide/oligopeptide/nickel transport system permease subunit
MWYVISIIGFMMLGFIFWGPVGIVIGAVFGFFFGKMTTSARRVAKMTPAEKQEYIRQAQERGRK